jgi:glutamate/tyrosine decarboxylase-like PLP-dependent enzyme
MATVENVNIEINQKLLDELAALKAEYQKLYDNYGKHDEWVNKLLAENEHLKLVNSGYKEQAEIVMRRQREENERLKEDAKLWVDYYNTISKLQADKAQLLEALNTCCQETMYQSSGYARNVYIICASLLSKHEAKS